MSSNHSNILGPELRPHRARKRLVWTFLSGCILTIATIYYIEIITKDDNQFQDTRIKSGKQYYNNINDGVAATSHISDTTVASSTLSPSKVPATHLPKIGSTPNDDTIEVAISSDAAVLGETTPEYVSTTLDWWALGTEAWGNASVLNANLSHPNLLAAAKGLTPYILRIGGSQADSIIYNIQVHGNNTKLDKECNRKPQKCLTKERWDEVLNFANRTGARILFTLAYIKHTQNGDGENDGHDWDSTNARQLLEYTAYHSPHAKSLYGFELGNELRHKRKVNNRTRIALGYKKLCQLVDEIWSNDELSQHKPKIAGPASTGKEETSKLLHDVGPYIEIASYHKYHGGGKNPNLQPSYSHPIHVSSLGKSIIQTNVSQLWIGEGAMAYNSGRQNITDSFQSSLWWANLLGSLAKTWPVAHSVYCRQALLGGYYELISHETLMPNPDYWLAYIWKQLIGARAIGPIQSPQRKDTLETANLYTFGCCNKPGRDSILMHTFCGKKSGDVVFIAINISTSKAFNIDIKMGGKRRTEYLLTPNEDGLQSRQLIVNGKLMSLEDGRLPDMNEIGVHREQYELFHVPPISIAFIVVHESEIVLCQKE